MTIAILYNCTGKYNQFFSGFYKSAEKYLLVDAEKHYFVWTDDDQLAVGHPDVHIYHKECAGFPADSLFRFEMFMQAEEQLKKYDYIYFINANALFLKPVGEEIQTRLVLLWAFGEELGKSSIQCCIHMREIRCRWLMLLLINLHTFILWVV